MRTLPERVYFKHNAYYFVTPEKQWIRLGRTEQEALSKYATVASAPEVLNTMNRVFDKYQLEVIPTKAERTQRDNLSELKNLRPVFGNMRPEDVKPRHISQYLALRTAKVRANREIALLSHVFTKALNWGVVEHHPCLKIEKNEEYSRDRYITDEELAAFSEYCPKWLRLYIRLKYLTGLRQGDLLKLRWSNVTEKALSLTIAKSGRGNKRKGQLRVEYQMTPGLAQVLKDLRSLQRVGNSTAPIFLSRSGKPHSNSSLDSAWDRAWSKVRREQACLEHFREHDVRAKSATDAELHGQDATALLSHSDKKTTRAYLRSRLPVRITPLRRSKE